MNILTDLVNAVVSAQLLKPQSIATSTTTNGTGADFQTAAVRFQEFAVIQAGTITDGSYAVKIQESTDNSTWTDISGATASLTTTNNSTSTLIAFYRTKRYLRAVVTSTGVTSGGLFAVLGLSQQQRPGATALVP